MDYLNKQGFTLIELVVVVAIIGLLSVGAVGNYVTSQKRAVDSRRLTDIENLRSVLELYRSDNGHYPAGTGSAITVLSAPLSAPVQYINPAVFPKDPKANKGFIYYYSRTGTNTYVLCAATETLTAMNPCPNASAICNPTTSTLCNYGGGQP